VGWEAVGGGSQFYARPSAAPASYQRPVVRPLCALPVGVRAVKRVLKQCRWFSLQHHDTLSTQRACERRQLVGG